MAYISNSWIENNLEILKFIVDSRVLKGKNAFLSIDKILAELKKIQETNETGQALSIFSSEAIQAVLYDMERYNIVNLKKSSGVTYVITTPEFATLRKKLEQMTKEPEPPEIQEDTQQIASPITTPIEQIYNDIINYKGLSAEFIQDLPKLIDLSIKLVNDKRTFWVAKSMLNSCLGYLLHPKSSDDYIDVLFLFSHVLGHVYINAPNLIKYHWNHPLSIKRILENGHLNAKVVLTDAERRELLLTLGIPKLFNYPQDPVDYRKTLGMIAYLMNEVYNSLPDKKTVDYLEKKLLSIGEFDEVQRYISISKGEVVPKSNKEEEQEIFTKDDYDLLLELDEDF